MPCLDNQVRSFKVSVLVMPQMRWRLPPPAAPCAPMNLKVAPAIAAEPQLFSCSADGFMTFSPTQGGSLPGLVVQYCTFLPWAACKVALLSSTSCAKPLKKASFRSFSVMISTVIAGRTRIGKARSVSVLSPIWPTMLLPEQKTSPPVLKPRIWLEPQHTVCMPPCTGMIVGVGSIVHSPSLPGGPVNRNPHTSISNRSVTAAL
mmetsp:Transcript_93818/g.265019  ORF Transcript_93818/g.265019 Transcript_93818/m.265019 type:complete len:204 (-) Transcript_93818:890-1501(-)